MNRTVMQADFRRLITHPYGNTGDIMTEMRETYRLYKLQPVGFERQFYRPTELETCRAVWEYVRGNIFYILDPPGQQDVKTPARTVADRFGDCKSYSVLIRSLLYCLNIESQFRFVAWYPGEKFKHVYVVALARNGKQYALDACTSYFNFEYPYATKTDVL